MKPVKVDPQYPRKIVHVIEYLCRHGSVGLCGRWMCPDCAGPDAHEEDCPTHTFPNLLACPGGYREVIAQDGSVT